MDRKNKGRNANKGRSPMDKRVDKERQAKKKAERKQRQFLKREKERDEIISQSNYNKVNDVRHALARFDAQDQKQLLDALCRERGMLEEMVREYCLDNSLSVVTQDQVEAINSMKIEPKAVEEVMNMIEKGDIQLRKLSTGPQKNLYEITMINKTWEPFKEVPIDENTRKAFKIDEQTKCFQNNLYHVYKRPAPAKLDSNTKQPLGPDMIQLSIKRLDGSSCRSWRDFQRIKNEILGHDAEAVELYPKEGRLQDTSNQYFLYCLPSPQFFPIGSFAQRTVTEESIAGSHQDPWPADNKPVDLITAEEVLKRNDQNLKDVEQVAKQRQIEIGKKETLQDQAMQRAAFREQQKRIREERERQQRENPDSMGFEIEERD